MLITKNMSLFDAPEGSILVHAVNAQGVWGSGIAKEMRNRFPQAYVEYVRACKDCDAGSMTHTQTDLYVIANLFTSQNYGHMKDSRKVILMNTTTALINLMSLLRSDTSLQDRPIYSNKFNSGIFGVPWEKTKEILEYTLNRNPHVSTWTVCEL